MAYGKSILSSIPADWVVENGSLTNTTMVLQANGSALYSIKLEDTEKLPETAEVTIVTTTLGILGNRVDVIGVLDDNTVVAHQLPLVDTGNGIYTTIIDFPEESYVSFTFKVSSKEGLTITEWSLNTPVSADFTEVINGVKQEIPKLLWDYNTLEFQVGQEECTVGMISARLSKNGDLQGHLQINFTASENSVVVIRIFDNEIQELYSPIEYVVKRGRNSVGIPHSYLKRKIGIHNFLVTMQTRTGTLTVETRGFLYTIDGGYLATRVVDVGYELYDLTIKQLPTEQDPSEIYAVCIDDGKALVRKRILNEEVAIAWEPVYIIEDAIQACIEFHGLWILRDGEQGFTLETEEVPFVVWRDATNVLWSQRGSDVTTKFQMAASVSDISLCMSYNFAPDIQYDQGVVCTYIKDGKVYYKNLCRQDMVGTLVWSAERELVVLGSGNTDVMVARLNDYRTVINAVNSKSQWLVSARGYVGQSIKPERFYLGMKQAALQPFTITEIKDISINSNEVFSVAEVPTDNPLNILWYGTETPTITSFSITSYLWSSPFTIELTCSHPLLLSEHYANNFKVYKASGLCTVVDVSLMGAVVTLTIADTISVMDTVTVAFRGNTAVRYVAYNDFILPVPSMSVSVGNPVMTVRELFSLTTAAASLLPITTTAYVDMDALVATDTFILTHTVANITTIDATLVGDFPL